MDIKVRNEGNIDAHGKKFIRVSSNFSQDPPGGRGRGQCFWGQNLKPLCASMAGNDIVEIVEKTEKETKENNPKSPETKIEKRSIKKQGKTDQECIYL